MPKSLRHRARHAFTLIELLIVVSIIGVLAALILAGMQRVRKSAAETRAVSALKTITQASLNFSAENNGIPAVIRWEKDPTLPLMPAPYRGYVLSSFWACTQPYLFPDIGVTPANSNAFAIAIRNRLPKLFGMPPESFTKKPTRFGKGSPFDGAVLMGGDWSGIPNPIAFNKNLAPWKDPAEFALLQTVNRPAGTIFAAYGSGHFEASDGETYVPTPTDGSKPDSQIYYLPSKRAIVSFLDGRVDSLTPPIDPKMFTIDD
jgi:prepilin-type N-terminal cleavage/methylation domain-containing protein